MIKLTKKICNEFSYQPTHVEYNVSWDAFPASIPMGTLVHRLSKDTYHIVWRFEFENALEIKRGDFTYVEELEERFTKLYQPLYNLFHS